MINEWYDPAHGLTLEDRLRRPIVSHAPPGSFANADLSRELVNDRSDALVCIIGLKAALKELRLTSVILLQNAEGCAVNHYGADFSLHGEPGWLRDCRISIKKAEALL